MDWKEYFTQRSAMFGETEFLKQVHKTVAGQPITPAQFSAQLSDIQNALELNDKDSVLDMCCGNGIITVEMAKNCSFIVGVDFSEPLINIAKKHNKPNNASYHCLSVLDEEIKTISNKPFTKIYMYEALQHFAADDIPRILNIVSSISSPDAVIFIGGIPDEEKLWDFYDTEERREEYRIRKSKNQDPIGTWWKKNILMDVCRQNGFYSKVLTQNPILHSARYRFDIRLTKRGS